jgi:hypothetical protein
MKVTICFDDVKVIVPCSKTKSSGTQSDDIYSSNAALKVIDVIESAVARYKKATGKVRILSKLFYNINISLF